MSIKLVYGAHLRRLAARLQNTDRSLCRYISVREGEEMVTNKSAVRVTARKNLRGITYRLLPQPEPLRDMNEASVPSITMSDMHSYVGMNGPGARRSARGKVAEFSRTRLILVPIEVAVL